jgi:hypothetical protein
MSRDVWDIKESNPVTMHLLFPVSPVSQSMQDFLLQKTDKSDRSELLKCTVLFFTHGHFKMTCIKFCDPPSAYNYL